MLASDGERHLFCSKLSFIKFEIILVMKFVWSKNSRDIVLHIYNILFDFEFLIMSVSPELSRGTQMKHKNLLRD